MKNIMFVSLALNVVLIFVVLGLFLNRPSSNAATSNIGILALQADKPTALRPNIEFRVAQQELQPGWTLVSSKDGSDQIYVSPIVELATVDIEEVRYGSPHETKRPSLDRYTVNGGRRQKVRKID